MFPKFLHYSLVPSFKRLNFFPFSSTFGAMETSVPMMLMSLDTGAKFCQSKDVMEDALNREKKRKIFQQSYYWYHWDLLSFPCLAHLVFSALFFLSEYRIYMKMRIKGPIFHVILASLHFNFHSIYSHHTLLYSFSRVFAHLPEKCFLNYEIIFNFWIYMDIILKLGKHTQKETNECIFYVQVFCVRNVFCSVWQKKKSCQCLDKHLFNFSGMFTYNHSFFVSSMYLTLFYHRIN